MNIQAFQASSEQIFIGLVTIAILAALSVVLEHLLFNAKAEIRKLRKENRKDRE